MDDGSFHVNGGIAAPIPSTPLDQDPSCQWRIQVSLISGPRSALDPTQRGVTAAVAIHIDNHKPFQIRP
jgi:hypothetical protein